MGLEALEVVSLLQRLVRRCSSEGPASSLYRNMEWYVCVSTGSI